MRADAKVILQHLRKKKLPEYPRAALDAGVGAVVAIQVQIGRDGKVQGAWAMPPNEQIAEGQREAYQSLLSSALAAVRKLRFEPYKLNDEAVELQSVVAVRFDPETRAVALVAESESRVLVPPANAGS